MQVFPFIALAILSIGCNIVVKSNRALTMIGQTITQLVNNICTTGKMLWIFCIGIEEP